MPPGRKGLLIPSIDPPFVYFSGIFFLFAVTNTFPSYPRNPRKAVTDLQASPCVAAPSFCYPAARLARRHRRWCSSLDGREFLFLSFQECMGSIPFDTQFPGFQEEPIAHPINPFRYAISWISRGTHRASTAIPSTSIIHTRGFSSIKLGRHQRGSNCLILSVSRTTLDLLYPVLFFTPKTSQSCSTLR